MDYTFAPILERIKKFKNEKKLTNETLSKKSGIPIGTLSKVLAGIIKDPKVGILIALSDALDVSVDYLAYGDKSKVVEKKVVSLDKDYNFLKKYHALDERGKKTIAAALEREYEFVKPQTIGKHAT